MGESITSRVIIPNLTFWPVIFNSLIDTVVFSLVPALLVGLFVFTVVNRDPVEPR
jgi:hypothetical protein